MSNYRKLFYENYYSDKIIKNGKEVTPKILAEWSNNVYRIVKDWLPQEKNINILDIGCGTGNFIFLLQRLGYRNITGIDLSEEQIEMARKLNPGAHFICGDINNFLTDNIGKFDLISGFDIIEHFTKEEIIGLLENINSALTAGGTVIFQQPNAGTPWMGVNGYGDLTHEWIYTPTTLNDLLSKHGFKNYDAKGVEPYVYNMKSLLRVIAWKIVKSIYFFINFAETGGFGTTIYTRAFIATAKKL